MWTSYFLMKIRFYFWRISVLQDGISPGANLLSAVEILVSGVRSISCLGESVVSKIIFLVLILLVHNP